MDPPLLPFEPNPGVWAVKVSKGFAAPLTIHYAMSYILGDPQTTYTFEFDAGPNPQPGKTWELNKEIHMAGYTFTLNTISVHQGHQEEESSGYNFEFSSEDGRVSGARVNIEGYPPEVGFGGGQPASFGTDLKYAELPKGKLNIILFNLQVNGETKEWSMDWMPDTPQSGFPIPTYDP